MGKASDLWEPGGFARKEEKQLEIRLISGSPTWPHPAILQASFKGLPCARVCWVHGVAYTQPCPTVVPQSG